MVDTIDFDSGQAGPTLLILGAVHGNEKCGSHAIEQLISELRAGEIEIKAGKVSFIPVCNPQAYEQNVRYVDENLNRIFYHHETPQNYEEHLANALVPVLQSYDCVLDLHSNHTASEPFGFLDYPEGQAKDFALSLGLDSVVTGWPELFYPEEDHTSSACARRGGGISVTVECGFHDDPHSIVVAKQSAINAMKFFNMIDGTPDEKHTDYVHVVERVLKKSEGEFSKNWSHGDKVKKGDVIGAYDDNTEERASVDGHIFIPNGNAVVGDEWFYIAVDQ